MPVGNILHWRLLIQPPVPPVNRIYRIVWNSSKNIWQVVSEFGSKRVKSSTGRARRRRQLALLALAAAGAGAGAHAADLLPNGGRVVAGQATLDYSGKTLTIHQTTNKAAIDWTGFSIGQGQTVNFVQNSTNAVALNRVLGADPSLIQGALNANGHVFLLNPNGVLFSPTAQVSVGGLLASTLAMSTDDFLAGRYHLAGTSTNAVANAGAIRAAGGSVALVAARVENTGTIAADGANALLGAGSDVVVDFGGPVKLQVQKGALDALVDNGGAIRADGGTVLMTAKSANELSGAVINNTGIVQARTLATGATGRIMLLGDMQNGTANVGGVFDASAPAGGDGGAIETSAAYVHAAPNLVVNAGAAKGNGGQWLVDPYDFTIDAPSAATISGALNNGTSVTVSTQGSNGLYAAQGASAGGNGDITVNSAIAKTAGGTASLTLQADHNVVVNSAITSTNGKLNITLSGANAAGATTGGVDVGADVKSNGGTILIGGNGGAATGGIGYARSAYITTGARPTSAAVTIETGVSVLSGGGNITINGKTDVPAPGNSPDALRSGVSIRSNATILSGAGNLVVNGESTADAKEFGIGFEALSRTLTTVGSAPAGGTVVLNGINSTAGATSTARDGGAVGLAQYGGRDLIVLQGPSVASWLVFINGAPTPSAYTQSPQLAGCLTPYPNCGTLVVNGTNNSTLYASYQAVDMSVKPIYVVGTGSGTKVYDGTTTATGLTYTSYSTLGGAFSPSMLNPAPVFNTASKNVATYGTLTADPANARNYTSSGTSYAVGYFYNGNYTITPKTLSPSAANKVYDGTTAAAVALGGAIVGDNLTASGTGTFASKDVGTSSVSITNIQLGGADAGNYTLSGTSASAVASITPRPLTLVAVKTYDGSAAFSGVTLGNVVGGEDLGVTGLTANSANVAGARYFTNAQLTSGTTGLAGNYQLPNLTGPNPANAAFIVPKALTLLGLSAADKTYDGTVAATLTGGTLDGVVAGENLGLSTLSGVFADKNVGTGKPVGLAGGQLLDGTGPGAGLASNYRLAPITGVSANITAQTVTVSGITAADKTYDGSTTAQVAAGNAQLQGVVGNDAVTVSATGSFADANAAIGKTVSLASTYGGTDVGNYVFVDQATATASIARRALTIAGLGAAPKSYDGTTAATLAGGLLVGLVGGERLDLNGLTGTFADKNAGSGKTVTVSGGSLADTATGRAANYSLTVPASVTGTITPKALSVGGITALDKTYDGTTAATLAGTASALGGVVGNDDVALLASGAFTDKNAGTGKIVVLNTQLGGTDARNYTLSGQGVATASITPKALTVSGIAAADKTYDGTTAATVSGAHAVLTGLLTGDTVTVNATGAFADADAGAGKTVQLASTHGGADAHNYAITDQATATAAITPRAVTLTGLGASDKVYDGGTAATLAGGTLAGLVGGETLNLGGLAGAFADRNAGAGKTVTVSGTVTDGMGAHAGRAANYAIAVPVTLTAAITPKALAVSGITAADKTYDGTTAATVSTAGATFAGLVTGDALTVAAVGRFADKNAGNGKTVALTTTYGGADAGNYTIADQRAATAAIAPKTVTVAGAQVADKTADGTTAAALTAPGTAVGIVAGDAVAVNAAGAQARFAQAAAGTGIAVDVTGLALAGADAGNYAFAGRTATAGNIAAVAVPEPVATPAPAPTPVVVAPEPVATPAPAPTPVVVTPAPVATPAPAPTPVVVTPVPAPVAAPSPVPASVAATTIAPQSLGLAPVLPAPAVGGLAYLSVPESGAAPVATAGTVASANGAPAADGQGEAGGESTTVSATNRRQTSSQALAAGRDVKYLNVLVVSGGIRMPGAGNGEAGGTDAPKP